MKSKSITVAVLAAAVCGPMVVLAGDQGADFRTVSEGSKTFVKDSVITTKVKARLAADHITSLARIHVDTDENGVVYLSGTAKTQEAVDTAGRLARDTEHVRDVRNDITVRLDD